jgi:CrcB protein
MSHTLSHLAVFVGAGIGGVMRYGLNRAALSYGAAWPWWSTLVVNVTGSLAIGLLAGWFAFRGQSGHTAALFLTTGVLGGYTTFSTFALDTALLVERGQMGVAAAYVIASVTLSIAAVFAGLAMMRT